MSDEPSNRPKSRREASRALAVGAALVVIGSILVLSPLVWGTGFASNKYFVLAGLVLACAGASALLNGGFDWLRSRR